MTGEFNPTYSTNNIWVDEEFDYCLTLLIEAMQASIATKVDGNHTHSGYLSQSDLEAELQVLEDLIALKANTNHTHSDYALTSHTHSDYATVTALDTLSAEVDEKADTDHTHTEYAPSSHTHTEYSAVSHDHDEDYADVDHIHSNYATVTSVNELITTVSGKANASHTHDEFYTETEVDTLLASKAASNHNHTGVYDASGAAANALTSANAYTDSKINLLVGEGASTTLDTIGEIASAIEDNQDAIDLLNAAIANKANVSHAHTIANVTNLQATLDAKALQTDLDALETVVASKAASSHTHTIANVDGLQSALDGKSATSHNHDSVYSLVSHNHSGVYSAVNHNHNSDYADISHTHTGFATSSHTHTASAVGAVATSDIATLTEVQTYLGI